MKKVALGLVVFLFCISSTVYAAVDLTGTWEGSYSRTNTSLETGEKYTETGTLTFELKQKGKKASGTSTRSSDKGDTSTVSIKGTIKGNIFKYTFTRGDTTCPVSGKGTAKISHSGDSMSTTLTGKSCKITWNGKGSVSRSSGTGQHTASGTYTYNSSTGVLALTTTTSDFTCEGLVVGTETITVTSITETTMTWGGDSEMTWKRPSGTADDITGTWSSSDSDTGNSWQVTFNADGTFSAVGHIVKCDDDGGGGSGSPSAQVVNNSGGNIYQVKVGDVVFTENLTEHDGICSTGYGCSTGFSDVPEGTNSIVVYQTATSAPISVGSLGSFEKNKNYAVNIRNVGGYCAELWHRLQSNTTFDDDTTRVLINTTCSGGGDTSPTPTPSATPTPVTSPTSGGTTTTYTNPTTFRAATAALGTATLIDFEDAPACAGNTIEGCTSFDGAYYSSSKGVDFSNPNGYPLYIAPGRLFWNTSKSLSVGRFPYDPKDPPSPEYTDDDLVITFNTPVSAVGFDIIDASYTRYAEFKDSNGAVIATVNFPDEYTHYREFIGIISAATPVKSVNIVDEPNDRDDMNYDDITFYGGGTTSTTEHSHNQNKVR